MTDSITRSTIRAVTKLNSWLNSCKIISKPQPDYTLLVQSSSGDYVAVNAESPSKDIGINSEKFLSYDLKNSLPEFADLTEKLGYGRLNPVLYRVAVENPTHQDFWIRHREVSSSPNPTADTFKKYLPILKINLNKFNKSYQNRALMWELGMELEDVESIAMSWIISYDCLHKVLIPKNEDHDEKIFQTYLKQRFSEIHNRMYNKAKRIGFKPISEETLQLKLDNMSYEPDFNIDNLLRVEGLGKERKKNAKNAIKEAIKIIPKGILRKKLVQIANSNDTISIKARALLKKVK